jgi:uncharacterized repeat protein (TIGR01451 family)
VANAGPSAALNVVVSDALPVSLTVASISSSAGGCTGFPCALGDVAAGAAASIYIIATVAQTVTGAIDNVATATTSTPLAVASDPDGSAQIDVIAAADLAVEKMATATALAGERITYTVVAVNNGPSDAADVVMTDTLAADVTVADDNGCNVSGNIITCAVGTLAAGAVVTRTLVVTAGSAIAAGALVTNQATIAGATFDPNVANNTSVAATRISRAAVLTVGKQGAPEPAAAGQTVTYTILITNGGPSALQAVTVYDLLPAGFSVVGSVADGGGICLGTGCTFAFFPAAATRTITLSAAIAADHAGGVVNNVVHVSATGTAPAGFTAQTTVNAGTPTTLAVSKVALNSPAPAGGETLYQIVVTNTGTVDALGVQLQEALPLGVYYAGSDSACTGAGGQVVCELGTLQPGAVRTVPLRLLVDSTLVSGTQLVNSVTAAGTNVPVPASAQATSRVFMPAGGRATLAFTKQAPATVALNGLITYTLRVTNTGPATAVNVTLADVLPNGVVYADALASQGTCNALIACQLGNLAVGAGAVVTVVGQLTGALQDSALDLTNVAAVHSDNPRPNNQFITAVFRTSASDIVTTTVPYLILGGSLTGQNAVVTSATVGLLRVITFTIEPTHSILGQGTIRFPLFRPCGTDDAIQATLYANDYCGVPNVTGDTAGQTTQRPQVVLSLSGGGSVNTRDQSWSFTVRNFGLVAATNVVVTNTLPQGFVYGGFVSAVAAVVPGTIGGRDTLTFTIPTVPPLGEVQVTITGTVDSCLATDTMFARLTAGCGVVGVDPDAQYCQGSQIASVEYTEAEGILLSSNDQSAVIPLCAVGDVTLIVKNVGVEASLYEFFLSQTLTDVTYVQNSATIKVVRAGTVIVPEQPFTPTSVTPLTPTLPFNQVVIWDSHAMTGYPASLIEMLHERSGRDEIILDFHVQTYCSSPNPKVEAAGSAVNACGTTFSGTEDAQSVLVNHPSLQATKTVRNASTGGSAGGSVFAGVGDELVWTIEVANIGVVDAYGLLVTDTLPGIPSWFDITAVSPLTTSQYGPTYDTVEWFIFTPTVSALPSLDTLYFQITGTVGSEVCTAAQENLGVASAACSLQDVCSATPYVAQAEVDTQPSFSLATPSVTLDQCGGGPLVINFPNSGARAENVVITYTLPAGLAYAGLASGASPAPDISPAVGATGVITWLYAVIAPESLTNTLRFTVVNDANVCAALGANSGQARLTYNDTCGAPYSDVPPSTTAITVQKSDISVVQSACDPHCSRRPDLHLDDHRHQRGQRGDQQPDRHGDGGQRLGTAVRRRRLARRHAGDDNRHRDMGGRCAGRQRHNLDGDLQRTQPRCGDRLPYRCGCHDRM